MREIYLGLFIGAEEIGVGEGISNEEEWVYDERPDI